MAVCTAETIQNGLGCQAILPPRDPIPALEALAPHLGGGWGVKLGLCSLGALSLEALASRLETLHPAVRIWDPILAPTSGVPLHDARGLRDMAGILLGAGPWVVSPNLPEAQALSGLPPGAGPRDLARPLLDHGAAAVWLKGGHGAGEDVEDFWITPSGAVSLGRMPRLEGDRRGTGCTLASAWLAFRLKGLEGREAASAASAWLRERWHPGARPGGAGRPVFGPRETP
jgi:hydroxymethylpyrimidine/phosphomethylpyrimidine kinase